MSNYSLFNAMNNPYNREVIQDLQKIDEKIAEAEENESYEEITKLRMAKVMRGMFLQGDITNNIYGYRPY